MKAIISGCPKGGTGKTIMAINLAYELSNHGNVSLLDADIDSPNLYSYMGLTGKLTLNEERRMIPLEYNGLKIFTMGAFLPDSSKGVSISSSSWRQLLEDAVHNVEWGDTDYLIVDSPAGTSREKFITLRDALKDNLIGVVVTTQPNIQEDVWRLYDLCSRHRIRILGLVENMKGVVCPNGHPLRCVECGGGDIEPFGNGVEDLCTELGLEYFGSIPLSKRIREEAALPEWAMQPIRSAVEKIIKVEPPKKGLARRMAGIIRKGH